MSADKPTILLVDDEHRFTDSLESILKHYGYVCAKAYNGNDAINLLKEQSFELALLDVALPDMSGCEIAQFITESEIQTTIIMLTGIKTVETAVEAMQMGAYDFLNKPLDQTLLIKTIEKGWEHQQLKKNLVSSEEKYKILSEAAWEGIVLHEDGQIIEANTPFLNMFGYTRGSLTSGIELTDLLTEASAKLIDISGAEKAKTKTFIAMGLGSDGNQMPIEVKPRVISYQNKPVTAWVVRDLTERLQAEMENIDLNKKLAEANKLNALGLMAGSVAHDLNNILTAIVSYPDMLLMQMDKSNKHYDHIQKIQSAGKRAAAVVSDLVTITRGGTLEKTVENINRLIMSYMNSLEHGERLASYSSVAIETFLKKDVANICCSPPHIYKVLLNLIGNALEAVPENGTIRIETENSHFVHPLRSEKKNEKNQRYIKLTVADNGSGIAENDLDHIFEPFYSTKIMGKSGTGLGLSVVWNIVQNHDGWIQVTDNNPGARFEVYLPATTETVCKINDSLHVIENKGMGEKILIVDDQAEQNEILESALTDLGYKTSSVTSGEDAINFLQNESVDLLVMDMIMGDGLSGRETLEIILNHQPSQKAIVVSGFAKQEELEKTRNLGISLFLEKPVTLARMNAAIQEALSSN